MQIAMALPNKTAKHPRIITTVINASRSPWLLSAATTRNTQVIYRANHTTA